LGERICLPHIRQELSQLAHGRDADLGEDAGEVGLRIDAVPLGAGDQGVEPGVGCAGFVVAGEEPVLSVMWSST
jgi:hypothetical protein